MAETGTIGRPARVYLTPQEVAAELRVTTRCVIGWCNSGRMGAGVAVKAGGVWRISLAGYRRWLRRQQERTQEARSWGSTGAGRSGGSASSGAGRKYGNRLEQLLGL